MCKKCKDCGNSNLGAVVTHIKTVAVRLVNGEVVEQFTGSETESQTIEINYCFDCNKEITEADLVEEVECPLCGKMVGSLTEGGICQGCQDEADKLAGMSKEQLILMLMKQGGFNKTAGAAVTAMEVKEEVKEAIAEVAQEIVDAAAVEKAKIEADAKEAVENLAGAQPDETTTAPKKRTRKKVEPAEVDKEEVNNAKLENIDKIEDIKTPATMDPSKVEQVTDTDMSINLDGDLANDPNAAIDINEVDDVLSALDEVDLTGGAGLIPTDDNEIF